MADTPGSDRFSFWTHVLAAAGAIPVLVLLIMRASGPLAITSVAVYGATLVFLFFSSSFHHVVGRMGPRWHAASRRVDHIAIFLLIAGTYTPISLVALGGAWGWSIFGVIWGLAVAGITLKAVTPHSPRWLNSTLYGMMGWIALVAIWPITQRLPGAAIAWLLAGGIIYTLGAVMYARGRPDPWPHHVGYHGVWHLFVMAAAACHAVLVWQYAV